jgi:plastocyanin
MTGDPAARQYRFSPAEVTASAGDTLFFVVESGGPHALGFNPQGLPEAVRDAWNRAMPRKVADFRGPVLKGSQGYSVIVPSHVPAGRYTFFCLAHRAYDMRLIVEVK